MNEPRLHVGLSKVQNSKTDFKKDFNNLEHAIWQANAIVISTIPGPNPVFIIKVAEGKYKISFNNPIFAVYAIIID